jgi:hypothetical protein
MLNNTAASSEYFCILICHFEFLFFIFEFVWVLVLVISDFGGMGIQSAGQ